MAGTLKGAINKPTAVCRLQASFFRLGGQRRLMWYEVIGFRVEGYHKRYFKAPRVCGLIIPEGPTYTTIMELGPQNHDGDGFLGGLIP